MLHIMAFLVENRPRTIYLWGHWNTVLLFCGRLDNGTNSLLWFGATIKKPDGSQGIYTYTMCNIKHKSLFATNQCINNKLISIPVIYDAMRWWMYDYFSWPPNQIIASPVAGCNAHNMQLGILHIMWFCFGWKSARNGLPVRALNDTHVSLLW